MHKNKILDKKQHRPISINSWAAVLHQLGFLHCVMCNILGIMTGLDAMVKSGLTH